MHYFAFFDIKYKITKHAKAINKIKYTYIKFMPIYFKFKILKQNKLYCNININKHYKKLLIIAKEIKDNYNCISKQFYFEGEIIIIRKLANSVTKKIVFGQINVSEIEKLNYVILNKFSVKQQKLFKFLLSYNLFCVLIKNYQYSNFIHKTISHHQKYSPPLNNLNHDLDLYCYIIATKGDNFGRMILEKDLIISNANIFVNKIIDMFDANQRILFVLQHMFD